MMCDRVMDGRKMGKVAEKVGRKEKGQKGRKKGTKRITVL
jgi:hypothetical protein